MHIMSNADRYNQFIVTSHWDINISIRLEL